MNNNSSDDYDLNQAYKIRQTEKKNYETKGREALNYTETELQQRQEKIVDVAYSPIADLIQKTAKILFMIVLFGFTTFGAYFSRVSTIEIVGSFVNTYRNNYEYFNNNEDEDTHSDSFFNVLLALLFIPESISFIYHFYNWFSKVESNLSIFEALQHFYPIFILDVITAISTTLFLFVVFPAVPTYLVNGLILSSLLLPAIMSVIDSYLCNKAIDENLKIDASKSRLNLLLDIIGTLLILANFVFSLFCYFTDEDGFFSGDDSFIWAKKLESGKSDIFAMLCIIFCPLFLFTNVSYTWFFTIDHYFEKYLETFTTRLKERTNLSYSLNENAQKISFLGSGIRLICMSIVVVLIYFLYITPEHDIMIDFDKFYNISSDFPLIILLNISSGYLVIISAWTSLKLGDSSGFWAFGLPLILSEVFLISLTTYTCETNSANSKVWDFQESILCGQPIMPNYVICIISIFVGISAWILICRHIFEYIGLKFLEWGHLFSTRVISSSIGAANILISINRRRNNNTIQDYFALVEREAIQDTQHLLRKTNAKIFKLKHEGKMKFNLHSIQEEEARMSNLQNTLRIKTDTYEKTLRVKREKIMVKNREQGSTVLTSRSSNPAVQFASSPIETHAPNLPPNIQPPNIQINNEFINEEIIDPLESNYNRQFRTPYIFMCPTLYQEDEAEIRTLVTSILRVNRYKHEQSILDENNQIRESFDFEVNIFFDNGFITETFLAPDDTEVIKESTQVNQIDYDEITFVKKKKFSPNHININGPEPFSSNTNLINDPDEIFMRNTMRGGDPISSTNHISEFYSQKSQSYETYNHSNTNNFNQNSSSKEESEITPDQLIHVRKVNRFVHYFLKVMKEVGKTVPFKINNTPRDQCKQICPPKITFWPYGIRLEYYLPVPTIPGRNHKPVKFVCHLKDPKLIQKGKRFSQSMYFYYLYGFKWLQEHIDHEQYEPYFLALDGDIDFYPDALQTCLDKLRVSDNVGVCCGRIHPTGSALSPLLYYQRFEYAIGHWLQKATEHIFGCVLCSPGCFSLIRGKALEENTNGKKDSVIPIYRQRPPISAPLENVQWNQGEDRWLCTLLINP